VPESRSRKRTAYTPPSNPKRHPVKVGSSRWVAPLMVACWVLGLAWIVLFYLLPDLPYLRDLGNWNLAIGMALIAVGFVFSTKWE
jgi:Cell division protein CrgA